MSQEQRRRPDDQPIRYGDVFPVAGELAGQAIAPGDAAMMHDAENKALGVTPKGGPASVMESAAMCNKQRGLIGHTTSSAPPRPTRACPSPRPRSLAAPANAL
ncbi:unnamed protein product [Musa acuminata subsp. malaccensis]|uniref:(wild Malaysian banana) hypothetical protein n=1 Tax=Musa acuminata subsp. malaccensis TaxID=214687 RepID=A0A804IM59_MUSAM|nr:unnamed protein product [Musa acuminata subsp. malaccensis]